jgi:hypothetical protein
MKGTFAFTAGFAAGWLARSTVASSRAATVDLAAFALDAVDRLKRIVLIERERLDDVVAEARARAKSWRARRNGNGAAAAPMEHAA